MSFRLTTKLNEKCACGSGKAYRTCCLRLEIIYLVIGVLAAVVLFFAHVNGRVNSSVLVVAVLLFAGLAGWLAKQFLKAKK
jgi:uncharacterized membrane protein YeaQ/YmgE (transglycosylase-associated protein family)